MASEKKSPMFDFFEQRKHLQPKQTFWKKSSNNPSQVAKMAEEIKSLHAELLEQARIIGMGSEREAKMLGQMNRLSMENLRLQEEVRNLKSSLDSV